jgi:hypothetical protein
MLWVTERTGKRVTRIDPATGNRSVAITIGKCPPLAVRMDARYGVAPELLRGTGQDYVYVAYTYVDGREARIQPFAIRKALPQPTARSCAPHTKKGQRTLSDPVDLIAGLPVSNDHVSGRLKIGPDKSSSIPSGTRPQPARQLLSPDRSAAPAHPAGDRQEELFRVRRKIDSPESRWIHSLRQSESCGTISHIYTYGHRNMQGIDFAPDGTLYASEQGPKTDDGVNILNPAPITAGPMSRASAMARRTEYARAGPTPHCALLGTELQRSGDPSVSAARAGIGLY